MGSVCERRDETNFGDEIRAVNCDITDAIITATIPKTLPRLGDARKITLSLSTPHGNMSQSSRVLKHTGEHPSELKIFRITAAKFVIVCNMEDAKPDKLSGTNTAFWLVAIKHYGGMCIGFEVESLVTNCTGLWVSDVAALDGGHYILFCLYDPFQNGLCTTLECYKTERGPDWYMLDLRWMAEFSPRGVVPRKLILHNSDHVLFDIVVGGETEMSSVAAFSGGLEFKGQLPAGCYWSKLTSWDKRNVGLQVNE